MYAFGFAVGFLVCGLLFYGVVALGLIFDCRGGVSEKVVFVCCLFVALIVCFGLCGCRSQPRGLKVDCEGSYDGSAKSSTTFPNGSAGADAGRRRSFLARSGGESALSPLRVAASTERDVDVVELQPVPDPRFSN